MPYEQDSSEQKNLDENVSETQDPSPSSHAPQGFPANSSPNSMQAPQQQSSPGLAASFVWLLTFLALFFVAAMLYMMGYGIVAGAGSAAQGNTLSPADIEVAIGQHINSPDGIVGVYLIQFLIIMPVLLFAAHYPHQHWKQTLGLHPFNTRDLKYWLSILCAFLICEYLLQGIFAIDMGEFIRLVSGSKHFWLSLVVVFLAPTLEEFIFRGYLFKAWRHTRLGLSGTLLLTSLIFAGLHISQYDGLMIAMLFIFSIILGLAREKTGSLWVPIILHSANNLVSAVTIIYLELI